MDQPVRRGGRGGRPDPRGPEQGGRAVGRSGLRRRSSRRRGPDRSPAISTRTGVASVGHRSSRPRWCSTSCCVTPTHAASRDGAAPSGWLDGDARGDGARRASTTSWRAASRATGSTGRGWCRTSRRCSTTTRSCSSLYARWADHSTTTRRPGRARDRRLPAHGAAHRRRGFASALDADSEGEEGTFYVWTPQQLVDVLGPDDGSWAARAPRR